nr:metal ABC transporter permease [Actinomycetota bacterium]
IAIAISARVVGVLLVSSLLVLPVAAVQQVTRSFRSTVVSGLILGATLSALGLIVAYYVDVAPAATIVLSSIMAFGLASLFRDRKTIR